MGAQAQQTETSHGGSFASLLANLTTPQPSSAPHWEDELESDVATLSYEQALKTHARYRPQPDRPMPPASETVEGAALHEAEMSAAELQHEADMPAAEMHEAELPAVALPGQMARPELKVASITIRMSQAESEQLRQRAGAAGLTISAYLRSCTLEAEYLRDLVKQTMAELKAATERQRQAEKMPHHGAWLRKIFPFRPAA